MEIPADAAVSRVGRLVGIRDHRAVRYCAGQALRRRPRASSDYVAKAQLDNYDNVRAQFEAFNAHMDAAKPSTGVIYWMLNNAWPSLHWHLYDYFLNPAGAYFGAKMANEPVHIQYSYDTRAIMLVNHTLMREHGLRAVIRVRNLDGSVAYEQRLQDIDLAGNSARQLAMLPALNGLSRTYFIELELASADGKPISRNVYWLSTQTDELDWAHSNWYLTPVTRYADLTPLQSLPDRDERGAGNDAARGSRGHRHSHADGTAILQGRGAVPARVDQAIRGRRAHGADPVERQRRHAVARRIADLDRAFFDARSGGAGRRSEWMERSDADLSRSPPRAGRPLRRTRIIDPAGLSLRARHGPDQISSAGHPGWGGLERNPMPAVPHVAKPARKFHFISGMPRSGSTLLAAILNQNPRFRSGMTSPLADIMGVVMAETSSKNDFSFDVSDEQRVAMLRGLVENFYAGQADAGVVFDTSRLWCSRMQLLETLFPEAKVIACVRQLSWVLDSMERLVRRQPVGVSKVFRFDTNTTVYSRVEALTDPRGMVGFSFQATKDAFYGQYAPGHLLLLTYESLARNPSAAMRAVYQFIGEPWFEHDFDHISYNADEFDARVGMPGLHTVRPKVEPIERTPILPREIFSRFVNESFWMDPKNNISQVPVV